MSFQEDYLKEVKEQNKKIVELLNETRPKEIQIVNVRKVSEKFVLSVCDSADIESSHYNPDVPSLIFTLEDRIPRTVREISVIGNDNFNNNAKLVVTIDDMTVIDVKKFGSFKNSTGISCKFDNGIIINPQEFVKIFVWTTDGSAVSIDAIVKFGE